MNAILTKDKCLASIGERPVEVTDNSKWAEMDRNAIANLHLALADGVLSSIEDKRTAKDIWDHLARLYEARSLHNKKFLKRKLYALLMAESTSIHNKRADIPTSKVLPDSYDQVIINLTSNVLSDYLVFDDVAAAIPPLPVRIRIDIAAIENKGRKRFTDVWLFDTGVTFYMTARREWFHQYKPISRGGIVYSCNDHELKIIGIGSIMVKMHGGTVHTIRDVRHLKGEIIEEAEASVDSHSLSYRVAVTWHQKLGHMSEQEMKILMERKLLPGLTKNWFTLMCGKYRFNLWEEQIYKAWVELDSRKKIKCLRMNNGDEYTGDEFDTFCKQEGIKRQFTTAYTPQQNGVAEQMNRTLKCLFLGYVGGVKGYRLWELTSYKVVISIDVVFMEDKIQENEEGDSIVRETTSIQMEKEFQLNDSFKDAPQHKVNETNESQALATRTLNRERKRPRWHLDYVMKSNVAYYLLT
ncbi:gag-pol polyprotein [Tanacetum coccineum]|uniref:Gag-pol polyprotein n=1 Tax=Tanacetum coccineum TaxID=301880 RepID=A0ABQ5E2K3_9ASTR